MRPTFSKLRRLLTLLAALAAACALAACTDCGGGPKDGGGDKNSCGPVAAQTPPPAPANVSGALIVTDISGSMNGFAQPGSARLYTVHDLLEKSARNAVASSEASPRVQRCYLGKTLDCQAQVQLRSLDTAATYSASESRLDLFMTTAPEGAQPDGAKPEGAKPADPLEPYRLSVLITDGMAARAPDKPAGGSPCLAGADPDCIAYLLKQRAEQGYGIWMALMLLPFRGTHYAERPLDNDIWGRVEQHVAGLSQDSHFQGVHFSVKRSGTAVPFTSYQFEGVKPILVVALSRDIQAGRNIIQQFGDAVRRESVVQPANAVYTMELAPLSVRPRQVTKISLGASAGEGVRPISPKRQPGLYDYLVECDRNAAAPLEVSWEEKEGTQAVPEGVTVTFNLAPTGAGNLPPGRIAPQATDAKTIPVQLTCRQLEAGAYASCFNLQAELKVNEDASAFWNALNADNIYEAPERLYGLREMIRQVLASVTSAPRVTDRVLFRVERK